MTTWYDPTTSLPSDTTIVWIRVVNYYGDAAQAEYHSDEQTFYVIESGLRVPAYMVARWAFIS